MSQEKSYRIPFILLTVLFFLWGFVTVLVDSLIPRLRELFELSYFQSGLVQFAFFGAYFLLSIPASYALSKIGYKKGLVLGLLTMALGCLLFYPAASYKIFGLFMLAYFILAAGITILQVAANPFVTVLGPEKNATSRLNLSQAFNALGTSIAPVIGAAFILSDTVKSKVEIESLSELDRSNYLVNEASAVQTPFLTIAVFIICIAVFFSLAKFPKLIEPNSNGTYFDALKHKNLMLGVLGIFFYVGAEVSIGSYLVNYFLEMNMTAAIADNPVMTSIAERLLNSSMIESDSKAVLGVFVAFYWTAAMVGRFIGAYLTRVINSAKILVLFTLSAMALILISINSSGLISMWSILAVGLFNSVMFPTIFSIAIADTGHLKPQASGLLCTAIVGGAIIPPIFGLFTDHFGFKFAYLLILCCYGYILFYGFKNKKIHV